MSGAATRSRKNKDAYIIDLRKAEELFVPYNRIFLMHEQNVLQILDGSILHVSPRGDYSSKTDEAELGPFQMFRLLSEQEIYNSSPCNLGKGDIENFILNRMSSGGISNFPMKLKDLFSDEFQSNYLTALIQPLCLKSNVALVDSYTLNSDIVSGPIDGRVHGDAPITRLARYHSVFCGTYNDLTHFIAYMVVMPWQETEKDGFILIFDPIQGELDENCLARVKSLAWYVAHVKLNAKPGEARKMPRMHVVQVHHPKEFTQHHRDYPIDNACNFWSTILLTVWLKYYEVKCNGSLRLFLHGLKSFFNPATSETYNFLSVNSYFTVARNPDYTMTSLRIYTALYLQQYYQHDDLKEAIKGLNLENAPELLVGADKLSYAKTKHILNEYWTRKSGMNYVTAGHADAYNRYMELNKRFNSLHHDRRAEMLSTLSQLDMYRIVYSVFDKTNESNSPSENEFYQDFMKRILIHQRNKASQSRSHFNEVIVQTNPGWRKCPYNCLRELAFDPAVVQLVSPDKSKKRRNAEDEGAEFHQVEVRDEESGVVINVDDESGVVINVDE